MLELNKRVLITGASSGIGHALTTFLLSKGAYVSVCARNTSALKDITSTHFHYTKADVGNKKDVDKWISNSVKQLGGIDILINNAGAMYYMDMAKPNAEQMMAMVQTNCIGFLNVVQAAMPYLLKSETPHMINVSSDAGKKAFPGLAVYSGTKAFMEFVSQAMRTELQDKGVRITQVQPGNVHTKLHGLTTDKIAQTLYGSQNEGQYLSTNDIVNAIYYALSTPNQVAVNEILIEPQAEPL